MACDRRRGWRSRDSSAAEPTRVTRVEGLTEYRWPNGLTALVGSDLSSPSQSLNLVYRVGSRNEVTGTTGGSLSWLLPSLIPAGGVIGFLLAQRLKSSDPARFAKMGMNLPD